MASVPKVKMANVRLAEDSIKDSLPQPGRYRHFKGDEYQVVNVARHSETEDWLVVYYQVDEPERLWVRPAPMFLETVKLHGRLQRRFELTKPAAKQAKWSPLQRLLSVFRFRGSERASQAGTFATSGKPHAS